MPTTRFRYAAFKGISVSNKVITSENVGSLETNNADLTGNVSLPATTTFDGTPLGSASTANVVGTVTAGVDEIPTSAAVNTAITTLDDNDGEEEKLENGKIVCANFLEVSEIQTKAEGIGANSLFYDEVDPLSSQLNRIKVSTT